MALGSPWGQEKQPSPGNVSPCERPCTLTAYQWNGMAHLGTQARAPKHTSSLQTGNSLSEGTNPIYFSDPTEYIQTNTSSQLPCAMQLVAVLQAVGFGLGAWDAVCLCHFLTVQFARISSVWVIQNSAGRNTPFSIWAKGREEWETLRRDLENYKSISLTSCLESELMSVWKQLEKHV